MVSFNRAPVVRIVPELGCCPLGLGSIQRQIWRAFVAHPDRMFRTVDMARWAYPRLTGKSRQAPLGPSVELPRVLRFGSGVIGLAASCFGLGPDAAHDRD